MNRLLDLPSEIMDDILEEIKNLSEKEEEVKKKPITNTEDSSELEKENITKE